MKSSLVVISVAVALAIGLAAAEKKHSVSHSIEIQADFNPATIKVDPVDVSKLSRHIKELVQLVCEYLFRVHEPSFSRTELAFKIQSNLLKAQFDKEAKSIKEFWRLGENAEMNKQLEDWRKFLLEALDVASSGNHLMKYTEHAKFSTSDVTRVAIVVSEFIKRHPDSLIDFRSVVIGGIRIRDIIGTFVYLLAKDGFEPAVEAVADVIREF